MKNKDAKKTIRIKKTGWMPFLIISGGLITLMILIKVFMKVLAK